MWRTLVLTFNLESQYASDRLRNRNAKVWDPKPEDNDALIVRRQEVLMELVFENGWNGDRGLIARLTSFQRDMDEAAGSPMEPRADVIEDKDAYHFYFEMPGLKGESLDVQVENDQLSVAAERKRPEWPQETAVHIAERGYGHFRRAFRLPLNASRDGIRAAYIDGVLELTVEKRAESKPVKVLVN